MMPSRPAATVNVSNIRGAINQQIEDARTEQGKSFGTICHTVLMNAARSFLRLIEEHFPKSHVLHKIFNRKYVNVSYSCMSNMATIIKGHNAKVLKKNNEHNEPAKVQKERSLPSRCQQYRIQGHCHF